MSDATEQPEPPSREFAAIARNTTASPTVTPTHTNGSRIHRADSHIPQKESRDPNLDVNLPYRTLSAGANFDEYTTEEPQGEIDGKLESDGSHHYKLVTFTPNDPDNPKNWSKGYRWYCTMVVAITCFVVAFASSVITADIAGVEKEFNVSEEVALVSISVFVVGFGLGMPHQVNLQERV
jgi:hypothetical protein